MYMLHTSCIMPVVQYLTVKGRLAGQRFLASCSSVQQCLSSCHHDLLLFCSKTARGFVALARDVLAGRLLDTADVEAAKHRCLVLRQQPAGAHSRSRQTAVNHQEITLQPEPRGGNSVCCCEEVPVDQPLQAAFILSTIESKQGWNRSPSNQRPSMSSVAWRTFA